MGASQGNTNIKVDARGFHKKNQGLGLSTISKLQQDSSRLFSRHDDSTKALELLIRRSELEKDSHRSKCDLKGTIKMMKLSKNYKDLKGKLCLSLHRPP